MKTYAVGDLHGRFDLLEKAIKAIQEDSPEGGRFIVLGDFVDRGPQSKEIIQTLIVGPCDDKWEWIVLQGNHEDIMLQANRNPAALSWWWGNGGGATLASYGVTPHDVSWPLPIDPNHIAWLMHLPAYFEDEHRIFVHAGVPHFKTVKETKRETLQWMLFKGDIPGTDADLYEDKPHMSGKHLVHGHHQSAAHPLLLPHRTNLDSFAWYTGRLAIGVFDDSQAEPIKILEVTE